MVEHGVDGRSAHLVDLHPVAVDQLLGVAPHSDVSPQCRVRHLQDNRHRVEVLEEVVVAGPTVAQSSGSPETERAAEAKQVEEEWIRPEAGEELAAAGDLNRVTGLAACHNLAVSPERQRLLAAWSAADGPKAGDVLVIGNGIAVVVDVDLVPDVRPIRRGRERPRSWVGRHCDNCLRGIGALEDIDIVDIPVALERTRGERAETRGVEVVCRRRQDRGHASCQHDDRRPKRGELGGCTHWAVRSFPRSWRARGRGTGCSSARGLLDRPVRRDPSPAIWRGMRRLPTVGSLGERFLPLRCPGGRRTG